jgi:hypothetical protein
MKPIAQIKCNFKRRFILSVLLIFVFLWTPFEMVRRIVNGSIRGPGGACYDMAIHRKEILKCWDTPIFK